jgi:hypothetical protein
LDIIAEAPGGCNESGSGHGGAEARRFDARRQGSKEAGKQGGREQGTKQIARSKKVLFVSIRKLEMAEIGRIRGNSNRGVSIRISRLEARSWTLE